VVSINVAGIDLKLIGGKALGNDDVSDVEVRASSHYFLGPTSVS
jgi:hypothetical protein